MKIQAKIPRKIVRNFLRQRKIKFRAGINVPDIFRAREADKHHRVDCRLCTTKMRGTPAGILHSKFAGCPLEAPGQ